MHRFNSLWVRLSLAFLLVTWGAIGTVALIVQNATEANFESYVRQQNTVRYGTDLIDDLKSFYGLEKTFDVRWLKSCLPAGSAAMVRDVPGVLSSAGRSLSLGARRGRLSRPPMRPWWAVR